MVDTLKETELARGTFAASPTVAFYDADPRAYADETLSRDLTYLYPHFLDRVPKGGLVLDAGCGAGRDIGYFLSQGYRVDAFDASVGLARLASARTGLNVEVNRFEEWIPRPNRYDGIWCFASLLHVSRADFPRVLRSLAISLKEGAPLFASFKWGEADTVDPRGREFTNFTLVSLRETFAAVAEFAQIEVWDETGPTALDDATRWLYITAQRKPSD